MKRLKPRARAVDFNRFIVNAGLQEFQMGERNFTFFEDDGLNSIKLINSICAPILSAYKHFHLPSCFLLYDWRASDYQKEVGILVQLKHSVDELEKFVKFRVLTEVLRLSTGENRVRIIELKRITKLDLQQNTMIKRNFDGDENTRYFHGMLDE
uniref:Uncharacterized protein n=1 Tax=Lactuca sativa TaxID=4236 RepID=A0A9R1WRA3_LACSA|nr:hypothetical protein LSAT_V11C900459610 [Lactuca sativa]